MQVGPAHWKCVTTDSCGVPSGGRFGNVKWFETAAGKRGLKVCWSRRFKCFGIYTIHAGKHVWQIMLRKPSSKDVFGDVQPFSHRLLVELCALREQDCQKSANTIMGELAQRKRDYKAKLKREADDFDEHNVKELARRVRLKMGKVTPNVMPLPKTVGVYRPQRRGRIVVAR